MTIHNGYMDSNAQKDDSANLLPDSQIIRANFELPAEKPQKKSRKKLIVVVLVLFLILASAGGVFAGYKYVSAILPASLTNKAFENLGASQSFTIDFALAPSKENGNVTGSVSIHKDQTKYQSVSLTFNSLQGDSTNNLKLDLIVNKSDLFAKMNYSKIAMLLTELKTSAPQITSLNTYTLLEPVLMGQKWIHGPLPKTNEPKTLSDQVVTIDQQKNLGSKLQKTLVFRSFNWNYSFEGKSYYRTTIGLDKQRLLSVLDEIGTSNLNIKKEDVSAIESIVNASDNWNEDLVEILIDKSGNLYSVSLSLPNIPEDKLNAALKNDAPALGNINLPKTTSTAKLVYIGKFRISNIDNVADIAAPTNLVEFSDVAASAQKELGPIFSNSLYDSVLSTQGSPTLGL